MKALSSWDLSSPESYRGKPCVTETQGTVVLYLGFGLRCF